MDIIFYEDNILNTKIGFLELSWINSIAGNPSQRLFIMESDMEGSALPVPKKENDRDKGQHTHNPDRIEAKFSVIVGEDWDIDVEVEVAGEGKPAIAAFDKVVYLTGACAFLAFVAYIVYIIS